MACSVVRTPLLRGSTVRHYAAAAAAQTCTAATPECQVVGNKVTVVACDTNSPIAQVSIVFRAGSRNETHDTQGAAHHLRVAAGLSTSASSGFAITRNIQQLGGTLTATGDRECVAYTLQITRDNLSSALTYLEDVATKQVFKPWELEDELPRLECQLASVPQTVTVIELLHKAAFRTGLGYSLFSPKYQLGKLGSETLQHFVNTWCTGPRCAVVGTGVPLSELAALALNLNIGSGDCANEASPYRGGEIRKERPSSLANVAIAVEGASLKNEKEALASAVLQRAVGSGPRVKWGSGVGPLHKNISSAVGTDMFAISTLNASYTDTGLFGVVFTSESDIAGPLAQNASKLLKSLKLSDNDVARGKAVLKAEILSTADNVTALLESLQYQALFKGKACSASALAADVENVSAADVKSVADKLSSGKMSMAAVGNLKNVPYIDDLK